jgi:hypothetical protein
MSRELGQTAVWNKSHGDDNMIRRSLLAWHPGSVRHRHHAPELPATKLIKSGELCRHGTTDLRPAWWPTPEP